MIKMINKRLKNKKALSTVVATVVIILLTVAAIAIVWTFVKGMVDRNKNQVESCFNVEAGEKVSLNGLYTCYADRTVPSDGDFEQVLVSLNIANVNVEAVVISIMAGGSTKTVTLTNTETAYEDVANYMGPGGFNYPLRLPDKNSGKTYNISGFTDGLQKVDWIKIAPIVNGNQCGVTDQINDVADCALLE